MVWLSMCPIPTQLRERNDRESQAYQLISFLPSKKTEAHRAPEASDAVSMASQCFPSFSPHGHFSFKKLTAFCLYVQIKMSLSLLTLSLPSVNMHHLCYWSVQLPWLRTVSLATCRVWLCPLHDWVSVHLCKPPPSWLFMHESVYLESLIFLVDSLSHKWSHNNQ